MSTPNINSYFSRSSENKSEKKRSIFEEGQFSYFIKPFSFVSDPSDESSVKSFQSHSTMDAASSDFDKVHQKAEFMRLKHWRNSSHTILEPAKSLDIDYVTNLHKEKTSSSKNGILKNRFILGLLIGILLVGLAIFLALWLSVRNFATKSINDSVFNLDSVNVLRLNNSGVKISFSGSVSNAGILDFSVLQSSVNISYGQNSQVDGLTMTPMQIKNGKSHFYIEKSFSADETDIFNPFVQSLIHGDLVSLVINADLTVRYMSQTLENVAMSKIFDLNGMKGFQDARISSFSLDDNGQQFKLFLTVNNDSPIEIEMGKMTFATALNSSVFANCTNLDFAVKRGQADYIFTGSIQNRNSIIYSSLVSSYFQGSPFDLSLESGFSDEYWLKDSFSSIRIETQVSRDDKRNIQVALIPQTLIFDGPFLASNRTVSLEQVRCDVTLPWSFEYNISQVKLNLNFIYNGNSFLSAKETNWVSTSGNRFSLTDLGFDVPMEDFYHSFLGDILALQEVSVEIGGTISLQIVGAFGTFVFENIPFQNYFNLNSMNSLAPYNSTVNTYPVAYDFNLISGNSDSVNGNGTVNLSNPSSGIIMGLQGLKLDVIYGGVKIGEALLKNSNLSTGYSRNYFDFSIGKNYSDYSFDVTQTLFALSLQDGPQLLNLSSQISKFNLNFIMEISGVNDCIKSINLVKGGNSNYSYMNVTFNNPLGQLLSLDSINGTIMNGSNDLGSFQSNYSKPLPFEAIGPIPFVKLGNYSLSNLTDVTIIYHMNLQIYNFPFNAGGQQSVTIE